MLERFTRGFVDGEYQDGEARGIMLLTGRRGMGKTTETIRVLSTCSGGVAFFDTLSKHESLLPGYQLMTQPGEYMRYMSRNRGRRFRALYQPRTGDLDAHFDVFCSIALAYGSMIVGIDEIDKLCGQQFGQNRMPKRLYEIINYGRHHRLSMLCTARTPIQLPRGLTCEAREMRLFRLTEPRYLAYFEEYIGAANSQRLPRLAPYTFLHWREGDDESPIVGTNR